MFLDNKYTKVYFDIINAAQIRDNEGGYFEKHHIIPRCMGGLDGDNIVTLTAREHYLTHLLLTKMTSGSNKKKMAFALSMFNTGCRNHIERIKPNSRWYEYSRRLLSESLKGRLINNKTRNAVSRALKGKTLSEIHKNKLSASLTKKKSFFAVSPSGEIHQGDDLKSFCLAHRISYNTVSDVKNNYVITAGKNKGWIFSKEAITDVIHTRNTAIVLAAENRKKAVAAQWNNNVDRRQAHKNRTQLKFELESPQGEVFKFVGLESVKHLGPPTTIQSAKLNVAFKYGKWAGWKRLK